jgi:hypothetical protein
MPVMSPGPRSFPTPSGYARLIEPCCDLYIVPPPSMIRVDISASFSPLSWARCSSQPRSSLVGQPISFRLSEADRGTEYRSHP